MGDDIGKNIKDLIKAKGITQTALARHLGISNGTLSDWISGRYRPKPKNIKAIAEYFGVTPMEISLKKDPRPIDDRLKSLFDSLSDDKKEQAIDYMRYLLSQRGKL